MRRDARPPARSDLPRSATNFTLTLIAAAAGLALIAVFAPGRGESLTPWFPYGPLLACGGIVAVIAMAEWRWPGLRCASLGALSHRAHRTTDATRVGIRLLGFAGTLALVGAAYWLLPEYRGDFYDPFWRFLRTIGPLAIFVPVYFWWADARLAEVREEYLAFGSLLLGRWRKGDEVVIGRHLAGWAVKAFFLPLMTVYLNNEMGSLYGAFKDLTASTLTVYQAFYHLSYTVDLLYCVIGYTAAIRLFDAHIRSVEPTVGGWLVALVCYQPFYSVIGRFYLQYDDDTFWDNWLQAWPMIRGCWAALIIVLTVTYALCTVSFGLRFSNLTHRGIITSGPYRFTKHPAYLAKNLSWWLISVPFVSELGFTAALRNCCLLGLLNAVYYLRARTEERHLSRDPIYVAYALWIEEHGMLRRLGRAVPFLRYRVPLLRDERSGR